MPRQIGLKDFHVAKITEDLEAGTTYEDVVRLERAISGKITPKVTNEKIYSDDEVEEVLSKFDSCEIEIEINQLSLKSRALLQGATLIKGELIEKDGDVAPEVAIGFRSIKTNGKYKYVWLYKGKFELAEDEYATQTDKVESKTPKLKGTFFARVSDKAWRITADEDEVGIVPTRLTEWFNGVPDPQTESAG